MRYLIPFSILLSLIMGGCGFQLRGLNSQLSDKFSQTHVVWKHDADNLFYRNVKRLISLNGGHIVDKKQATISIYLSPVESSTRQIAQSSDGSMTEYEKNYRTTVTIINQKNGIQLGSRTISTIQNIQLDDSQVLAGQEQTNITNSNAETLLSQSALLYLQSF